MMAEASRWRYLRVPVVGQSRIMQLDGKSGEPGGWFLEGRETDTSRCRGRRESCQPQKVLMVSVGTRSAMRPSTKRPVSSIKAEPPPPGSGATVGMVLDPEGESILNSDKSRLKANGVQDRAKGFLRPAYNHWPCGQRRAPLGRRGEEMGNCKHKDTAVGRIRESSLS